MQMTASFLFILFIIYFFNLAKFSQWSLPVNDVSIETETTKTYLHTLTILCKLFYLSIHLIESQRIKLDKFQNMVATIGYWVLKITAWYNEMLFSILSSVF